VAERADVIVARVARRIADAGEDGNAGEGEGHHHGHGDPGPPPHLGDEPAAVLEDVLGQHGIARLVGLPEDPSAGRDQREQDGQEEDSNQRENGSIHGAWSFYEAPRVELP
jgi:hypothetical protein